MRLLPALAALVLVDAPLADAQPIRAAAERALTTCYSPLTAQPWGSDGFLIGCQDPSLAVQRTDALGNPIGAALSGFAQAIVTPTGELVSFDANIATRRDATTGTPLAPGIDVEPETAADVAGLVMRVLDSAGDLIAVWRAQNAGNDIFARRFDAALTPLGPAFQVYDASEENPSDLDVIVLPSGDFVVWWSEAGGLTGRFKIFDGDGVARTAEITPPSDAPNDVRRLHIAAGGPDAALAAVWVSLDPFTARFFVRGQRYDVDGGTVGARFESRETERNQIFRMEAAGTPDGDLIVGLDADATLGAPGANLSNALLVVRFDATNAQIGPVFRANLAEPIGGSPRVAVLPDGRALLVYEARKSSSGFTGYTLSFGTEVPAAGQSLALAETSAGPTSRSLKVQLKDTVLSTWRGGPDPVRYGAHLQLWNASTGESACLPLPASGWVRKGSAEKPSYDYEDSDGAAGPCTKVTLREGKLLKATCKAKVQPIPFSLDEPSQEALEVAFHSGTASYCAAFGGQVLVDVPGRFSARRASAPPSCAPAPVACP